MFGWSRHELVDLVLTGARQVTARDQGINTEGQRMPASTLGLEVITTWEHSRRNFDVYSGHHHLH